MFLLDIAKAFDRVPLALLWKIMGRLGVPAKLIVLLRALHGEGSDANQRHGEGGDGNQSGTGSGVKVRFVLEDAETVVIQTLGVKQGDVLGPELYLFHGIGLGLQSANTGRTGDELRADSGQGARVA